MTTPCTRMSHRLATPRRYIFETLQKNAEHWNNTVEGLAQSVQKTYTSYDSAFYEECGENAKKDKKQQKHDDKARKKRWKEVL